LTCGFDIAFVVYVAVVVVAVAVAVAVAVGSARGDRQDNPLPPVVSSPG
jgi:hypothetical protein